MAGAQRGVRSILIVDDDHLLLSALERDLRARGLEVYPCDGPAGALELARARRPDCALLDLCIGEESGIELLRELKRELPQLVVLLFSGHPEVNDAVEAFHGGAIDFLQKPIGGAGVMAAIERAEAAGRAQRPTLARAEFEHITRVLRECGGNVSEAARRLGIHRRSLQRKLSKAPPA